MARIPDEEIEQFTGKERDAETGRAIAWQARTERSGPGDAGRRTRRECTRYPRCVR